jgi:TolB protein
MNADGGNPRKLSDERNPWNAGPCWSPDGKWIAFQSNVNGFTDIYRIKLDGLSPPQQLTFNMEIDQDRAPAWRPLQSLPVEP